MPERDDLDMLIDSALSTYAEPRPGIEQRILAHIEAVSSTQSGICRGWRLWVLAGALAMAVVLLVGIPRLMHREVSVTTARATVPDRGPVAVPKNAIPQVPVRHLPRVVKSVLGTAQTKGSTKNTEYSQRPKLDVFPASQPLSTQERALVALATVPSASGRESLMAKQRQLDEPLEISAIQIAPITMPDEGKN